MFSRGRLCCMSWTHFSSSITATMDGFRMMAACIGWKYQKTYETDNDDTWGWPRVDRSQRKRRVTFFRFIATFVVFKQRLEIQTCYVLCYKLDIRTVTKNSTTCHFHDVIFRNKYGLKLPGLHAETMNTVENFSDMSHVACHLQK